MEWSIAVNDMLKDEITKVNYLMIPPGFQGDVRAVRVMQESLSRVIDSLGELSATAQGLNKVITTSEKLRLAPNHILYLLKDATALGGKGEAIGLLKVGQKHLFLFDERGRVVEAEPLCVLDFFVLGDRQRHGHGRRLFDYMLQDTGAEPDRLAIDGPSAKMERFLSKNYGVTRLLRQNNNFAVAPNFFVNAAEHIYRGGVRDVETPAAVGRFTAPKPTSAIASVIHGGGTAYYQQEGAAFSDAFNGGEWTPAAARAEVAEPSPSRPRSLQVRAAAEPPAAPEDTAAPEETTATDEQAGHEEPASKRDSQLTERGYFDIKFYHNKLW